MDPLVQKLAGRLRQAKPEQGPLQGGRWAAVMVIIHAPQNGEAEILFVKRAEKEGDPWSGQVALPGGMYEEEDPTLLDTAIREVSEEVGIDVRHAGRILGALDAVRPGNMPNLSVTPYVALLDGRVEVKPGPEVQGYFWAPLRELKAQEAEVVLPSGRKWVGDTFRYGDYVIWGLTAKIINTLLDLIS